MKNHSIYPTIQTFISSNNERELVRFCARQHPADLAAAFEEALTQDMHFVMTRLNPGTASKILSHMAPELQSKLLIVLSDEELSAMIQAMYADDRVDLIRNIPDIRKDRLLHMLAKAERQDILKLESYAEGTAGAIMTSDYAALPADITVREALEKLRLEAPDKETIYYAYVINKNRSLIGSVSLRELILARPETRLQDIMHMEPVRAKVEEDQEEVARKILKYDLLAIPVTNGNEVLVGIITHDDVADVLQEEATEDFHRFGAMSHKVPDLSLNIRDAGFFTMLQKRLPWLLVLVFMNIFSGAGIAVFEDTIAAVVSLVFFLPLLIDSGGNAGSQSATLMVRALAVGDVKLSDWLKLLKREIGVAIGIGLCMGLAVSMIGIFRAGPDVAVVVAMTMVLTVLFGSLVGMSLPFLLTRFRLDPATASAPLITSIADIGGVLIYFSIATWYLKDIIAAAGAA
ncbi:magnesium transporter [Desulfobotulus alkaliphilus]|uniref:Magnesium transporter MgtE n=1 Tax=Desulfobotulus alkaliphilus TaxID=622671 RepID=A0A562RY30_9BACT|nr:magnesium transporter [Desulfobotulus alkaliphilus]TWI73957.1 magnesium transporter [Desulfobotulus alkaliphilus]